MPTFFQFTQGSESSAPVHETSPLLGRFRAVPPPGPGSELDGRRRRSTRGLNLLSSGRGSVHVGHGALVAAGLEDDDDDDDDDDEVGGGRIGDNESENIGQGDVDVDAGCRRGRRRGRRREGRCGEWRRRLARFWRRDVVNLWIEPKQGAVKRLLDVFWKRYGVLVVMPATMAIGWCALPFPQYRFRFDDDDDDNNNDGYKDNMASTNVASPGAGNEVPGHGAVRVQLNFWFFLFVYYGFYNLVALIWITKVFNLYSLNWWPRSLGFPLTLTLILVASVAAPIPVKFHPSARYLTAHNTAWISWTFVVMAVPLAIAFLILTTQSRHVGPRVSLSETQRIFTSSWWTGEPESPSTHRDNARSRHADLTDPFENPQDTTATAALLRARDADEWPRTRLRGVTLMNGVSALRRGRDWFPASFVRFLWLCVALFVGLLAYVLGEAYAEVYLRTLPHDSLETILYVYSWVVTVHLLDALAGWVLGIREGERVGSYPLSWVFKLYFTLTYQTYVRALYARLRSPRQFVLLQVLSSTSLVVLTPLTMTRAFHRAATVLGLNGQSYPSYQKLCLRNVFIRFLAENSSMAAFLGSVLVLHFGANRDVYPYFAFDDPAEPYDFPLTFWASSITWACELAAGLTVRAVIAYCFGVDVGLEGKLDLAVWPELLPTCVAVTLHVLQNMLFSIIRLQFR